MSELIAYCGLSCTNCAAYIATQENDTEKLTNLALEWYGVENDATYCLCDGCTTEGRKNKWCNECKVHDCAKNHGVINCAYCDEYGCETISNFFTHAPNAKENLDLIRLKLMGV